MESCTSGGSSRASTPTLSKIMKGRNKSNKKCRHLMQRYSYDSIENKIQFILNILFKYTKYVYCTKIELFVIFCLVQFKCAMQYHRCTFLSY